MSEKTVHFRFLNILRCLLFLYGLALLFAALFDQSYLQNVFSSDRPLSALWEQIETGQIILVFIGVLSLFLFRNTRKWQINENHILLRFVVLSLTVAFPLMVLEIALRPFRSFYPPYSKTTVYVKDEDLIWKLNPGFEGIYDDAKTKINSKGLRGQEIEYQKPSHTHRILFLGDSVIFGYMLNSYKETIPYRVEKKLNDAQPLQVQCINSGVSGYSPWQEYIYLKREGIRFDPDLVLAGFVLNDVTEKFALVRFGGTGLGKLSETYLSVVDTLAEDFALVFFMRKLARNITLGENPSQKAREMENVNVKSLFTRPDAPDIRHAWEITLENIEKIVLFCKERDLPFILLIFPYQFQFEEDTVPAIPQEIVSEFAEKKDIAYIDLLPPLQKKLADLDLKEHEIYIDSSHFNPLGCRIVADIVAEFLLDSGAAQYPAQSTAGIGPNK